MTNKDSCWFPHPETSDKQGLLAMGGDLSPERLLKAYSLGIFPWFQPGCPILWWCPNPRLVLYPNEFKVSRSLRKSLKGSFDLSIDTAFLEVITQCATSDSRSEGTWITSDMIKAYTQLHQMGYAHSFEVWEEGVLVGGLYGISLGQAFFGESMFHIKSNASKIAFHFLCNTLCDWGFHFVDCQIPSAHLISLGAKVISRKHFLHLLYKALQGPDKIGSWALNAAPDSAEQRGSI